MLGSNLQTYEVIPTMPGGSLGKISAKVMIWVQGFFDGEAEGSWKLEISSLKKRVIMSIERSYSCIFGFQLSGELIQEELLLFPKSSSRTQFEST